MSNTDKDIDHKFIRGKRINFLIGSGASAGIYNTLKVGNFSFEDLISKPELEDSCKYIMYAYYFIEYIYKMSNYEYEENDTNDNIENYKKFINWMYKFLLNESNEQPKRINIFTTNYDLLFEHSFDHFIINKPLLYFNDGSRGVFRKYINNQNYYLNLSHSGYSDNYKREIPTVNLFKLHGSVSWKLDSKIDKIIVEKENKIISETHELFESLDIDVLDIKKIINESKSIEDLICKLNNIVKDNNELKNKLQEFYSKYKNISIVNPNKSKFHQTVLEQHYYQLIRSFSYELEEKQSILIVFGFSFSDEHITDIIKRSLLNPELHMFIISYNEKEQKEIKREFEGYKNVTFLPKEYKNNELGDFKYLLGRLNFI